MSSLWFVVPVHGRLPLARICLRQLRRTCDSLIAGGVQASAVVVGTPDDVRDLGVEDLGFARVHRDNSFLGRKFNDGIQLATDPSYNPHPADYVVPLGSDDWVDHRLFLEPLPQPNQIYGFQWISFVNEDGSEITPTFLNYKGGSGIRIIPRQLVAPLGYRPADEDRRRACDMSIFTNLRLHHGEIDVRHWHLHDKQIVDWKSPDQQLNVYDEVTRLYRAGESTDPFAALAELYPAEALNEMQAHYASLREPVAA